MKTLTLPLNKKWFDMIKSGKKKEEYRKIKPFWIKRLLECTEHDLDAIWNTFAAFPDTTKQLNKELEYLNAFKSFDSIVFTLGYPKADDTERRIEFKNPKIRIGQGRYEWGAKPGQNYFVITWEAE